MPKRKCIILLGAPRSGTTLLATAIGCHEKICMLDEDFHGTVHRIVGGKTRAVKFCVPNVIQMHRKWRTWWGITRFNGYIRKRLHYVLPRSYYSLSDYLRGYDCRIICILREPNKALSALSTRGLINMGKAKRVTHKVYDLYEELLRRGEGNVAFISFDKYLTEPEAQTKEICDFIGEEFSPAMLDGPRRNTRYPGEGFDASKIGKEEYDFDTMDKDLVSIVRRYQSLREHAL